MNSHGRSLTWSLSSNRQRHVSRRRIRDFVFLSTFVSASLFLTWLWINAWMTYETPLDSQGDAFSHATPTHGLQSPMEADGTNSIVASKNSVDNNNTHQKVVIEASAGQKRKENNQKGKKRQKRGGPGGQPRVWQNCSWVKFDGIDLIKVANTTKQHRIYCFLMSHNKRKDKLRAVYETWGPKCDYLLVASNVTNPEFNAIKMHAEPTYENLWNKLNETLHYIRRTTNDFTDYDWYFKVDDDSFIVMENLHLFLQSSTVQEEFRKKVPLIYGRLFAYPEYQLLPRLSNFFTLKRNRPFRRKFLSKFNGPERLVYASGGAGYIMNREFLLLFLETLESEDSLFGQPDEDMAVAVNTLYRGVRPKSARDSNGLQLFHPELPPVMYNLPKEASEWLLDNHQDIGGIFSGAECCSPYSVTFHHAMPIVMRYMNHRVYHCP